MATNTYVALATYTIPSNVASYTFTGISQAYTDLVLVANGSTVSASNINLRVGNGSIDSSGNNYSQTVLNGNGSSATSTRSSNQNQIQPSNDDAYWNSTVAGAMVIHFQNYSNTTTYKTILSRANHASLGVSANVGLWRSTSAINQIYFGGASQNFVAGTTLSLYGIAAEGTTPTPKATGGAIYSDSTYYYHVFGSTGTFTPLQSISADVLVVAGGAGGAGYGAGGAGGISYQTGRSLSATGYTVTIGAGGAGNISAGGSTGGSGGNSVFDTITSNGGGGGRTANTGVAGGSGGSGSYNNTAGGASNQGNTGGATGYGNAGGSGYTDNSTIFNSGGGGGAGAAGNAGTATPVVGGNGLSTWSSWGIATGVGENISGTYYLAGGGGGNSRNVGNNGRGGYGGGGYGGNRNMAIGANGINALQNMGGGGGSGDDAPGGNGGSGVVIVRYAK
jgi:hypothetical protein